MGSVLAASTPRTFRLRVDAPRKLTSVELIRNGETIHQWQKAESILEVEHACAAAGSCHEEFYLIRATQEDGHKAWSSPIWFTPAHRANASGVEADIADAGCQAPAVHKSTAQP